MNDADRSEILGALDSLTKELEKDLRVDIMSWIDEGFASYRASFIAGDRWCCAQMEKVGTDIFHVSMRPDSTQFGTQLQIAGAAMVYCPFCGVKLA